MQQSGKASTEDLRDAMLRYRTLFEQLVGEQLVAEPQSSEATS